MTWERATFVLLFLWFLALGYALRPGGHQPPRITHAPPLEQQPALLPTLPATP